MGLGGENSAGAASPLDLSAVATNVARFQLRRVMWMSEAATKQAGNATLQQIGAALNP